MAAPPSPHALRQAPFVTGAKVVQDAWIDYNGHLNMAYYNIFFDESVDEVFALFGLGPDYVRDHGASFYTAEAHLTYVREIHAGDEVEVRVRLLDFDAKKAHVFFELWQIKDDFLSAAAEQLLLHVDMTQKKVTPFPAAISDKMAIMHAAHAALPPETRANRAISMNKKG